MTPEKLQSRSEEVWALVRRQHGVIARLDLADPETVRSALDLLPRRPGVGRLRGLLDPETFALTDSELESRFLRLVHAAGLPRPETQAWLNGYRVDAQVRFEPQRVKETLLATVSRLSGAG
jgi:hypothetical protein